MTVRRDERSTESGIWRIPAVSERDHRALAGHTHSAETSRRCRIVLLALEGWSDAAIANRLDLSAETVTWWKDQFAENGITGLIDRPTMSGPSTAAPLRDGREVFVERLPSACEAAEPQFDAPQELTDQSSVAAIGAAQRGRAYRATLSGGGWTFGVRPRLVAAVELVGAFGSPRVHAAGLLEVHRPDVSAGRRAQQVASPKGSAETRAMDGAGPISWLSRSQPVADQLAEFIRQARESAPGRRLHVVTPDPPVYAWLRSRRSRDSAANLTAHLAAGSQAWLSLMEDWASQQEDPTDAETIRRLRASDQRFSWLTPTQQAGPGVGRTGHEHEHAGHDRR